MASTSENQEEVPSDGIQLRLRSFTIDGLFGAETELHIPFPQPNENRSEANILILQGRNGSGKTTILNMIAGMLKLDFDTFRRIPFSSAKLVLSTGQELSVRWRENEKKLPLLVKFEDIEAGLVRDRIDPAFDYNGLEVLKVQEFRARALPVTQSMQFELLGVDRSSVRASAKDESPRRKDEREMQQKSSLAAKVKRFILEAQVNHREYFRSEELTILPSLLERLNRTTSAPSQEDLVGRVANIRSRSSSMKRFGLQTSDDELQGILSALAPAKRLTPMQLQLVETYVEVQESLQKSRELVSSRLVAFEGILDEFFLGKQVQVDSKNGLRISSKTGPISEHCLSSGEYHFLYMMVSALLCQRLGSIIAIDEPELSLHVRWQRKLLGALSRCSSGASPLFICATHSQAISAEHSDRVQILSAVD